MDNCLFPVPFPRALKLKTHETPTAVKFQVKIFTFLPLFMVLKKLWISIRNIKIIKAGNRQAQSMFN